MPHLVRVLQVVALAASVFIASPALAGRRVALLIGNGAYRAAEHLTQPANDVALLAQALQADGFDDVTTALDVDRRGMMKALRDFQPLAADADIAVLYYSGLGIEHLDVNYLLPVDALLKSDRDLEDETVTLDRLMASTEGASRLRLVLIDACRTNPFWRTMKRYKDAHNLSRGLIPPAGMPGTGWSFVLAAEPRNLSVDGDGPASPFATALGKRLAEKDRSISAILNAVARDVVAATDGKQRPFVFASLLGDVTLAAPDR